MWDNGLDRGQAYDGACNMAGKRKGAAAIISAEYPLALYLHCAFHCLKAVVKSLGVQFVWNMIGILNRVSLFVYAHPKRQQKLDEAVESTTPSSSVRKLKKPSAVRGELKGLMLFSNLKPFSVQ